MIAHCFVICEYNPIKCRDELRILSLHRDRLLPCTCNPDPIGALQRAYTIVSGQTPLSRLDAEDFIKAAYLDKEKCDATRTQRQDRPGGS
jgi:hypothetical protein